MLVRKFLCAVVLLLAALSAQAAPVFSVTFLPDSATVYAINGTGLLAGEAAFAAGQHAALWDGLAGPADLGTLGADSGARAISSNGFVTGLSSLDNGTTHAFLFDGAVMRELGAPNGGDSVGLGVNAQQQVAGYFTDAAGNDRPFLTSGATLRDLGTLGGSYGQAHAINDAGVVVGGADTGQGSGPHAFLYSAGVMHDLGTLGGPASYANAINAQGQVAGSSFIDDNVQHAFLYSDGAMRDLGSLGGEFTEAYALNNLGMVVGYSTRAGDLPGQSFSHAFLYRDGVMSDLNALADAGPGWVITDALAISDSGQIAGRACNDFVGCRAVLLAPVPEPHALALLLAGLVLAGASRVAPRSLVFK